MSSSLLFNIGLLWRMLFLTNIPAYFLGLKFEGTYRKKRLWFGPPGFVIPIVWVFLMMAYLRYKLVIDNEHDLAMMILILAFICATHLASKN